MLGCEIVEKSKIAFRARAPGRRNPHSSSSPGKPDTWQRGVGDPMAGTWRDAKCKLPRRSSPSTEKSASDATSRSTPDDRRGHTRIRRNQSKDRATGESDDAKVSSPVRRGADGKGRSRLPVTADAYTGTDQGFSSSNEHLESNTTRVFFIVSFPRIDSKPSPYLSRSSKTRCDSRSP